MAPNQEAPPTIVGAGLWIMRAAASIIRSNTLSHSGLDDEVLSLARSHRYRRSQRPVLSRRHSCPGASKGPCEAVPASPDLVAKLARRYSSPALGDIAVAAGAGATTFDFGEWKSRVASRKNDDGTISFLTIDPTNMGFEFVVADRSGKRALVIRDGQHEYVFTER